MLKNDSEKAKQEILEEYQIWVANRLNNKPIFQLEINDKLIDLSFQKVHDLARQEFEKENKKLLEIIEALRTQRNEFEKEKESATWNSSERKSAFNLGVMEGMKIERLSFAQKLEELKKDIEESLNFTDCEPDDNGYISYEDWEKIKLKIDSLKGEKK